MIYIVRSILTLMVFFGNACCVFAVEKHVFVKGAMFFLGKMDKIIFKKVVEFKKIV